MLQSLHIENIAVIERAEITFDRGLNVLTGETGAGKSIVIDAINAVLGERVSREMVRTGSAAAKVTAVFCDLSPEAAAVAGEAGFAPDEDGCLLIRRTVSAEGKGACHINGHPATVAVLRQIGRALVNMHGQHENQALLVPERHLEYLDRLGGLQSERDAYYVEYRNYCDIRRRLKAIDTDEEAKARRMDLLRYQIDEITAADIKVGEEEELLARREMYRHAEKTVALLRTFTDAMFGNEDENGVLSVSEDAAEALEKAGRNAPPLENAVRAFADRLMELREAAEEVRVFADELHFYRADYDYTEERLETIRRMTSKYGADEAEVLAFLEAATKELSDIELSDERAEALAAELQVAGERTVAAAAVLTEARKNAAAAFGRSVMTELTFLDMPRVRFEVSVQPTHLTATGGDIVEFLIAANPGEPPRSIAKVASGGELSRIMLAIKSVMAHADDIDTLIFDEVDTGISGRAARKVGIKLRQTGEMRQILCVTHLAQIASQAHHHLLISKSVRDERTYTDVLPLDEAGQVQELARIIGGEVTDMTCAAAREMLQKQGELPQE